MVNMNQFRRGMVIEIEGRIWRILEFQHVKPGKGGAFMRTKLKNLDTGAVQDRTFREKEDYPEVVLESREMELLYHDAEGYHFMDQETYEQITLSADDLGDAVKYLRDHDTIQVSTHQGRPVGVELPASVTLRVEYTEPAVKGDTATGATKPARLETGLEVKVPLFIEEGEQVRVDTRTGEFLGRA